MRQVMRTRPWTLPVEPPQLVEIFRRYGREVVYDKGQPLSHGGLTGDVSLLLEGMVTFSFVDIASKSRIFALILPGRTIGDLDALNPHSTRVVAECIRPSRLLVVSNEAYRAALRSSVELMELYADLAILKAESVLEGAFANFTMDLDGRLRALLYSLMCESPIFRAQPNIEWCACPVDLTVTEIARIVAGNRSWVSTKLSEWTEEGLVRRVGRVMEIRTSLFSPVYDWLPTRHNVRPDSILVPTGS
ncbi:MAG: Crp/Fnr family transcriptional regulator [Duodenibacillus sp.]|nr:Crp/Fnr family transcriptional regulator [Duodenibacillus sp.]